MFLFKRNPVYRGFAAPFSPGAGAYFGNDMHGGVSHGLHELHGPPSSHLTHHHVSAPPMSPMPMAHHLGHQMGPHIPPPPEPAPSVPPAQLPQVPSHVPTQNGSGPQVPSGIYFFPDKNGGGEVVNCKTNGAVHSKKKKLLRGDVSI